ncbi:MAG: 1,3-beta-galactosyl-N-acetylhexosamine phosphorylase, partial [Candidatus Gallimonas sp.]
MNKGRVTIPTDENYVEGTKIIAEKWGADAVRDCDGTELPKNVKELAEKVYNTYFVVRGDNEWADKHSEETHRTFLMSARSLAERDKLQIDPMQGYFPQQIQPDTENISYWEVYDRTTGEKHRDWKWNEKDRCVLIMNARLMHEYTVNFMAKVVWHPVQIYNYLTNNWTCAKQRMYDPAFPNTAEYIKKHMEKWCNSHPETDVVRFTTFLYQFTLIFNEKGKEKYVDWFGYGLSTSPAMLQAFEKEYGYALCSEDFVRAGNYNSPFRNPDKKFLDWIEFVQRKVSKTVRELVDIVHAHGKEAMMFLGDDWIGAEPYGEYFKDMNLDAVVGSVGGGVTVRMLSEIPHVKYREGRFLPYFFPDTFFEGNEENAIAELNRNWITARRAMMRKPLDRMGFGGYLSLAAKFPKFIERAGEICDEFRAICDAAAGKPYAAITVAVLNAWGKKRSWMCHMVAHELWYQQVYSYQGVYEALSGLPVNVKFISFDEIKSNGIDEDIDVILNVGDEGTAFSGGEYWNDAEIVAAIRKWVAQGHGFIGVGEPTAYQKGGKFFQLSDVLGVDEEKGLTLSEDKYNIGKVSHYITEDTDGAIDYGEGKKNIYALDGAEVLDIEISPRFKRNVNVGEVKLAANGYGKG